MKRINLKDIDQEDIEFLLIEVEYSFEIQIEPNEFAHVNTFDQLFTAIKSKINRTRVDDCTSQQAFYKLRQAIRQTNELEAIELNPSSAIAELLPRKTRKNLLKKIETNLGFSLSILRHSRFVSGFLSILLLMSIVSLFFNWKFGILAFGFTIFGFWFADKVGIALKVATIGELVEKMTKENYIKSRRNETTVNESEIDRILNDMFKDYLDTEKTKN